MQHILDFLIFKKKMKIFVAAMLVLAVVYFGFITKKSKADEMVFFPKTCEGTWENADKVSGDPEEKGSLEGAKTLSAGDQIACYDFQGSLPDGAIIKDAALEFMWGIDDKKNPGIIEPGIEESYDPNPGPIIQESPTDAENKSEGTLTDIIPTLPSNVENEEPIDKSIPLEETLPVIEKQESIPTETPLPSSEPTSVLPSRLQSLFMPTAHAQEEVVDTTSEISSANTNVTEDPLQIESPPSLSNEIITGQAVPSDTTKIISDSTTTVVNSEQNDIFDIRYGLGENDWQNSGRLSREQLSKPTSLTLTSSDISILKVSLSTRLTLEPLDNLVLKGVKLIVTYDEVDDGDPIKQPNLKVDTILDDVTVDGIRAIRLKRAKSKTQEIWYQTVKNDNTLINSLDSSTESESIVENLKVLPPSADTSKEIPSLPVQDNMEIISDTEKVVTTDSIKLDISDNKISNQESLPPTVTKKGEINKGLKNLKVDWNLVATNEWIHENSPLGLQDGLIFWFSKEGNALYSFNILTQGVNTQIYEPVDGINYIRYINQASKEKKAILDFSKHIFIFSE